MLIDHTLTYKDWGLAAMKFCVQIWTFHILSTKIFFLLKLPQTALPMTVQVALPNFGAFLDTYCICPAKNVFKSLVDWAPTSHIGDK